MRTCGTTSGYQGGCRCDQCQRAYRDYMREYRRERRRLQVTLTEAQREMLADALREICPDGLTDECPARRARAA